MILLLNVMQWLQILWFMVEQGKLDAQYWDKLFLFTESISDFCYDALVLRKH